MYRRIISTTLLVICLGAGSAMATPSISLLGKAGALSGAPGSVVGFGFDVNSDPSEFISFTGSVTIDEDNPSLVAYTDFIGMEGGPGDGVLAPNSGHWTQNFDASNQTGVGFFQIDPSATAGSQDKGVIRILYASYNSDPNTCSADCGGTPGYLDVKFDVVVTTPNQTTASPEPATFAPVLLALGLILCRVLPLAASSKERKTENAVG